jgi:TonB-linked SusC/RagA family outer membrane protein
MKKFRIFDGWDFHFPKKTFRIMRITIFILLTALFQSFATETYSQKTKLSFDFSGVKLTDVLDEIESRTEFFFLFNEKLVDTNRKVTISVKEKLIEDILKELFEGTDVVYTISDRKIILAPEYLSESQQQKSVSGKVTSTAGDPLPGVTVVVKGTINGTTTDANGNYSLTNIPVDATLAFSFVGMKSQEISVTGKTSINVILAEETVGIEEVVAIGYGTIKKVNLTGSVVIAGKEIFEDKSVPNTIAAIQGTIPGVTVIRSSGKPGSEGYNINIRGASSVNNVGVLVVIDGVPGQSLEELNPNDIESMSVLKDAAAASIYGSNAAGGVILVTTKKGKAGKTVVEYSGIYGLTHAARTPHTVDSYTNFNVHNIGVRNSGVVGAFDDDVKMAWFKGERLDEADKYGGHVQFYPGYGYWWIDPNASNRWESAETVDHVKEFLKDYNPVQTHNLSIRGGNENNTYSVSLGYYNRQGMLKYGPDSNERYNARLNMNNELNKYFSLNTSVAFTNRNVYQPSYGAENVLRDTYRHWPNDPTYQPDGNYNANRSLWPSTVQEMKEGGVDTKKVYFFDGRSDLTIKDILPGLKVNLVGSKNYTASSGILTHRTLVYTGINGSPVFTANSPNDMQRTSSFSGYSSLQAFATYNRNFNESHHFTLMGGYSYEDYKELLVTSGAKALVTNDFYSLSWGDASTKTNSDNIVTWATMAFFGRLNYDFKERYLFEADIRYDGSSRLAPETRWNFFPSFSAGWNIAKEEFFKSVKNIQELKLRTSWGQLGNSNALGYYDYISMLNAASNLPFNNTRTQYVYQTTLASPTKTWETIQTGNIALDVTTCNGKLSGSFETYVKKNKNMLANLQVPSIIGVGLSSYNVGELETRGWDFNLTWKDMAREFKYWITLNLSDNTNKLLKYEGKSIVAEGQNFLIEGQPINTLWGYKTDGLFQSNQEYTDYGVFISPKTGQGDMKYLDLNGDKKINVGAGTLADHGDLVSLGDTNPRYSFGVTLGFRWKGFDFSSFFQGVGKRKFLLNSLYLSPKNDASLAPIKEQLDFWTPDNPNAFWPRPYFNSGHSYWASDYWVQDAAYIRLKNLELGFTVPQSVTRKKGVDKVRLFVSGQDLWEYTKAYSFIDPESLNNTAVGYTYPFYRSLSLGLNITF